MKSLNVCILENSGLSLQKEGQELFWWVKGNTVLTLSPCGTPGLQHRNQAGVDQEHTRGDSRKDHSPERSFKGANSAPQNTSQTKEQ